VEDLNKEGFFGVALQTPGQGILVANEDEEVIIFAPLP
jgi:hypothetical protein